MAIGDPYAGFPDLVARYGGDVQNLVNRYGEHVESLQGLFDPASRAVEAFTRRQFNKATTATPRRFRPVDWRRLPVDDFHTVTGLVVTVDGTAWDLANVDPHPWNGMVDGQSGWPFFDLIAVNRSWSASAVIMVTAQWGWPAVPTGIREATLDVFEVMAMSGGGGSLYPVRSEAVAGYSVTYQSSTVAVADAPAGLERALPYRRKRFGIA